MVAAFELYQLCRAQQFVTVERGKGKKTEVRSLYVTTGLAHLPWDGGMEDQPQRTMQFFEQFLRGDNVATQKALR